MSVHVPRVATLLREIAKAPRTRLRDRDRRARRSTIAQRRMHVLRHARRVAADVEVRAVLEPAVELAARARGSRAARRPCRPDRARTRDRAGAGAAASAPAAIRPDTGNRERKCGLPKNSQLRPLAPVSARSCRKPRNGATPVPGPIMIDVARRIGGQAEAFVRFDEDRHRLGVASLRDESRSGAVVTAAERIVGDERDRQMRFVADRLAARRDRIEPRRERAQRGDEIVALPISRETRAAGRSAGNRREAASAHRRCRARACDRAHRRARGRRARAGTAVSGVSARACVPSHSRERAFVAVDRDALFGLERRAPRRSHRPAPADCDAQTPSESPGS